MKIKKKLIIYLISAEFNELESLKIEINRDILLTALSKQKIKKTIPLLKLCIYLGINTKLKYNKFRPSSLGCCAK